MVNVLPRIFVDVIWVIKGKPVNHVSGIQAVSMEHVKGRLNVHVKQGGKGSFVILLNVLKGVILILDIVIPLVNVSARLVVEWKEQIVQNVLPEKDVNMGHANNLENVIAMISGRGPCVTNMYAGMDATEHRATAKNQTPAHVWLDGQDPTVQNVYRIQNVT